MIKISRSRFATGMFGQIRLGTFTSSQVELDPGDATSAELLARWRADNLVLRSLMRKTGTTPPDVTLTGDLNQTIDIRIDINVGGSRGVATFDWYLGDQLQESGITTDTTYILGATGLTANFSTGTYNADNIYDSAVSQLTDLSGNENHLNSSGPGVGDVWPTIIQLDSATGQPAINLVPSQRIERETGTFADDLLGGVNNTFDVFFMCRLNDVSATRVLWSGSSSTSSNIPTVQLRTTTSAWEIRRRLSTGTDLIIASDVPAATGLYIVRFSFDGTNGRLQVNGVDIIGGDSGISGTLSIGSDIVLDRFVINSLHERTSYFSFGNQDVFEVCCFDSVLLDSEASQITTYFDNRYDGV